jgi:hypothetical protein
MNVLRDLKIRALQIAALYAPGAIPLVHFLRDITDYSEWKRPPLRATFVIDDPNLHWPTYGFISFAALARHAREHGYHVAFATIPLDAWFTHKRTARLFRQARSELSLAVHGNDHLHRDLERLGSGEHAIQVLRTSLARIEKLERRAQVSVARVMVPPHNACPDRVLAPLVATGFEALCREPAWWRDRSEPLRAIGGWGMADVSQDGLPVLARHLFSRADTFDELVVEAFLDQPVIPFGHARDLAEGYEQLAALTRRIRTLGPVRWSSLAEIAQSNYMTRTEDDRRLRVRLFSRRAHLVIPEAINEIVVELPPEYPALGNECVVCDGRRYEISETSQQTVSAPIPVRAGGGHGITARQAELDERRFISTAHTARTRRHPARDDRAARPPGAIRPKGRPGTRLPPRRGCVCRVTRVVLPSEMSSDSRSESSSGPR